LRTIASIAINTIDRPRTTLLARQNHQQRVLEFEGDNDRENHPKNGLKHGLIIGPDLVGEQQEHDH